MMKTTRRIAFLSGVLLAAGAAAAEAQTSAYLQLEMGLAAAPGLTARGTDNDWSTKCDLIINPQGLETGDTCSSAPPATEWTNALGGGAGVRTGLAVGYDWGRVRVEAEYSHRTTVYDDRTDIAILDDVTLDKSEQEIEFAVAGVDDLRAQGFFANVYYDFAPPSSAWSPYVGAGVGLERVTLDYESVWKRNDDPERIRTFVDPALRAKVAGTTTISDARLSDTALGYQLLAGLDYRLRDPVTLGFRFRWAAFGEFESAPQTWTQLRSHESSVGRGGPVEYQVLTDDNRYWGVGLTLRYTF